MKPYTPSELVLGRKLKRAGIVNPLWTIRAAKAAGISVALACAFLEQESGGGNNVWGHDPTIFVGGYDSRHHYNWGPKVTKAAYLTYRAQRGSHGQGGMQGVGPMQLTWYSYQDKADALGGCWTPLANMTVGFQYAASNIRKYGKFAGIRAYNGSGPAAERYAHSVLNFEKTWAGRV